MLLHMMADKVADMVADIVADNKKVTFMELDVVKEVVPEANLMCAVAEMQKTLSTIVLFFHQLC